MHQPRLLLPYRHHLTAGFFAGAGIIIVLFLLATGALSARAQTAITQGFSADEPLPQGAIVSLRDNAADLVSATATSNIDSIYGVVINNAGSPISLSKNQANEVYVATSGVAPVLVSDMNGDVVKGDHITASPIKGVGMKATSNIKVIGTAQGDPSFSSGSNQTYTEAGEKKTVKIGEVPVLINVAYYYKQPEKTLIPVAIQNMANALAGKTVSTAPILISAAVFIITLVVVASIIYAMIRSSIISVGRNPMAQSAVYRDVVQLSALVIGILAVALITIYLLLTRL